MAAGPKCARGEKETWPANRMQRAASASLHPTGSNYEPQQTSPRAGATLLLLLALAGCATPAPQRRDLAALKAEQAALTPAQALASLQRGSECFATGKLEPRDQLHDQQTTAAAQYPHAATIRNLTP